MKSSLERKWWFVVPVTVLAMFVTRYLMDGAGLAHPQNLCQWALFCLCFGALHQIFSLLGWFLVLTLSPADKARERTR